MSKGNGGKEDSWSRIKNLNGNLELGEKEVRRIWKDYFEDLYNIDTQGKVAVRMCGFDGIQSGNYFRGKTIKRNEVEVRVLKLTNGNAAGKDEVVQYGL